MKRRNFFKAFAAVAVVPILPKPKDGSEYIEFECNLAKGVRYYKFQGDGYYVGMYSPKGAGCGLEINEQPPQHGPITVHKFKMPRHGVHSWEFIERTIE